MVMTSQLDDMTSSSFVWACFVSPLKFSHRSKFHVNIITGSVVMTIFFYKGLTRNQNYPSWVFPNIWTQGQLRDTRFGTNFSNKILLNAAKWQGYSFYRFWIIKGKPTKEVKLPVPTQIKVNTSQWLISYNGMFYLQ